MAALTALDKVICYLGMLVGVSGIVFSIYMFLALGDAVDALRESATGQVDSAIVILNDAHGIVSATAGSMDSLTAFAKNSSLALGQSADSLDSMGSAVSSLAASISLIPYMPGEASASLESAADGLSQTAKDMKGTAASMQSASDNALATMTGVSAMEEDISGSIQSLHETKMRIDGIHATVRLGLLIGTILAVLMFALNGLSFYRQLRQ
jgi:hypothetical protein